MPDVFISYRRDDTSGYAGRLYDQISAHFGADHVFMDVADIGPGSDFVEVLEKQVGTCDALIALIGKNWLTAKDDQNRPRLGNSDDFVSTEILAALKRNIEVIPVLVGGAKMPLQRELPESLQTLGRHQALALSDTHFTRDVQDLIAALEQAAGDAAVPARKKLRVALITAAVLLVLIAAGIFGWQKWEHRRGGAGSQVATGAPAGEMVATTNPSRAVANLDISGNWKAVLQKNGSTFNTLFTFEVSGDKLFGRVVYPTGEAGIQNGTISNGRISFITRHTPQFAEQEATITVDGRISGDEIEIVMQDDNGFAKGVAHRVNKSAAPR
jgi:hypothetical protein